MEREVELVDGAGVPVPVVITAGTGATVADLRDALGYPSVCCDGRPLPDGARLDAVHLPVGARLGPAPHGAPAVPRAAADHGDWELAVVGGLAAGGVATAGGGGTLTVGRDRRCGLAVDDPEVSRRHARVELDGDGGRLSDEGSRNGVGWQGFRLGGPARIGDGDVFAAGESVFGLRRPAVADAVLEPDPAGVRYNRPPRLAVPAPPVTLAVPAAPGAPRGFRFPLVAALAPLAVAGVVYAVLPSAGYFLIFLALSPIMLLANAVSDRRSGRREHRRAVQTHERDLAALQGRLAALAAEHGRRARHDLPDPAAVRRIATGPSRRLFERRPADPDFLLLRLGLADRPVPVVLTGPGADGYPVPAVPLAPSTVDVAAAGVLGIAGPRGVTLAAARAALCQLATLHAPGDLQIVLLTGRQRAEDWAWASWLPHTLAHTLPISVAGGAACRRWVATDATQVAARVDELRRLIAARSAQRRATLGDAAPAGPRFLVVVDGARRLREVDGVAELLAEGPAAGVYALCLDSDAGELPDECRATAVVGTGGRTRATLSVPGAAPVPDVLLDGVPVAVAADVARALAPVRVLGGRGEDAGGLPDSVRLLDLAGLGDDPDPAGIAAGWVGPPRSPRVLLGSGPRGPVEVDLRRDGPHALIAGTSGSGKSELLQTLVAGLAANHPPDELSIVLVDYKGGSAFGACRDLPHCAGLVTDLDGHLVNRALASLNAELKRREALLAAAEAKDIDDFWAGGGRLARLVIVIDEFASLVAEVPEFVSGVVGIGMRGRSLGVHVVLATQRPAGVVSAELRANVNLRICLRVTSAEESRDVIDVADAARLSRRAPGRALVRTGHGDLTPMQTARIGAPRPVLSTVDGGVRVAARRMADLGDPPPVPDEEPAGHDGDTDLTVLVRAVCDAAALAGREPAPSPWLPDLPEQLILAELPGAAPDWPGSPVTVALGLADHPSAQAQRPYLLDLAGTGPVAVAGMARSGRSTVLRTLAAGLADRTGPGDVHLYVVDYGNRALAPLAELPHCGAYVDADAPERVDRLLAMLSGEVRRRQRIFAAGGYGDLAEQRAGSDPLPYLVLLLDAYEAFLAQQSDVDGGRLVDTLDGLLRAGPAVGVLVVLATDRSGFTHRLAGAVATRLVLRQADREDLSTYGLVPRQAPRRMPPGRVLVAPDGPPVQVALLRPEPDGSAQAEAVRRLAATARRRWDGVPADRLPRRVDPLPAAISTAELAALASLAGDGTGPDRPPTACLVGAGGDHLGPVEVDLAEAGAFLVAGPPRSGRSTALAAIVDSLAGRATGALPVAVLCPRPSPLRALAGAPGVVAVLCGLDVAGELDELLAGTVPVAVVVDDAELLADGPVATVLERFARYARDDRGALVAAGTTDDLQLQRYRGWLAGVRRARTGLLLAPASHVDGELFDLRLPRSTGGAWPPGRGLLVGRGETMPLQVPSSMAAPTRRLSAEVEAT